MSEICKLCMHADIKIKQPCDACYDEFSMFKSGIEQQLQQAHREGWEQAKREAVKLANTLDKWGDWESDLTDSDLIANAIAAMEYPATLPTSLS